MEDGRTLDETTESFVRCVHHAWDSGSPLSAYIPLRNELLARSVRFDAQVASLSTVVSAVMQRSKEDGAEDEGWNALFSLASRLDSQSRIDEEKDFKRKRAYNINFRARNLAIVAAFWSFDVIRYYGWESASHGQTYLMRKCAVQYPHFSTDFCVQLNRVLLHRHRESIRTGRGKSLYEAPLQPQRDFRDVLTVTLEESDLQIMLWTTNQDGRLKIDDEGTLLNSLRPQHFHLYLLCIDYYGMLSPRKETTRTIFDHRNAGQLPAGNKPRDLPDHHRGSRSLSASGTSRSVASVEEATEAIRTPSRPTASESSGVGRASHPTESTVEDEDTWLLAHIPSMETSVFSSPDSNHDPDTEPRRSVADGTELQIEMEHSSPSAESSDSVNAAGDEGHLSTCGSDKSQSPSRKSNSPNTSALNQGRDGGDSPRPSSEPPSAGTLNLTQKTTYALRQTAGRLKPQDRHMYTAAQSQHDPTDSFDATQDIHRDSLEKRIYRKYGQLIASYVDKISREPERHPQTSTFAVRAKWLQHDSKLALIWTSSDSGLPCGSVSDPANAEVLYYSADDFIMDAQAGKSFRRPVVIKEQFTDTGIHTVKSFCNLIQGTRPDCKVDIRKLESKRAYRMPVQEFVQHAHAREGTGMNALNFRCITKAHRPVLTMLPRFRLLETLTERLSGNLGKEIAVPSQEVSNCIDFNILGLAGSFSGPHLDALGGTWIRNLEGVKFWMIVPEHEMRSEWDAFAVLGDDWTPRGKERLIVLEQDDILLMPPGISVIHAAHSPTSCLMQGGMLWDYRQVIETLESIRWICSNQATTNEAIPHELPHIIAELADLAYEHTDRFSAGRSATDFMVSFKAMVDSFHDLGCQCPSVRCARNCTCREAKRRCTSWCSKHDNSLLRNCMAEY